MLIAKSAQHGKIELGGRPRHISLSNKNRLFIRVNEIVYSWLNSVTLALACGLNHPLRDSLKSGNF